MKRRLRDLGLQAALLLAVGALFFFAFYNARKNLAALGIPTSFAFLNNVAGFGLNQSVIAYSPASTYGRALLAGVVNTLLVSALSAVLATIIGFAVGFARLSRHWALSRLAGFYVESLRNIPLLLQMLFWYVAVLTPLPGPEHSLHFAGLLLNSRGLYFPAPVFVAPPFHWLLFAAGAAAFASAVFGLRAREAKRRAPAVLLALVALAALIVAARPAGIDFPVFDAQVNRFNVEGGLRLPPEVFALVLALSLYTATYIAEIVRAGVNAVPRGQIEAAAALGLSARDARKQVILPQAMRVIMPPLISQYLALTKNSSLAAFVGFADLMQVSGTIINQSGAAVQVIALDMAIYLGLSLVTLVILRLYERRFAWGARA